MCCILCTVGQYNVFARIRVDDAYLILLVNIIIPAHRDISILAVTLLQVLLSHDICTRISETPSNKVLPSSILKECFITPVSKAWFESPPTDSQFQSVYH